MELRGEKSPPFSFTAQSCVLYFNKGEPSFSPAPQPGSSSHASSSPDSLPGGHKKVFKDNLFLPSNNSNS